MKVKELIKQLEELNQEAEVIIASDEEGNNYSVLSDIVSEDGLKFQKLDYEIDLYDKDYHEYEEITAATYKKLKECIVLYPS